MLGSFIVISSEKWIMFSNYLLLEANECCGTCDILLKKCILHCLDGPKFHRFDTSCVCHAFVPFHCCLVVTCWERAGFLALDCDDYLYLCHFHMWYPGNVGQVWYLIASVPALCHISYLLSTALMIYIFS